jgi:hypothetical protein
MDKKDIKKVKRAERNKKIYEKYINILNGLKKKQDKIVEKYIKKKESEEIEKIREKLK